MRTVTRRKKTQTDKRPDAIVGPCGWCISRDHGCCLGMRSDHFTCTCKKCYGVPTTTKKENSSAD